ncbi:MAG: PDZ domain-containing protein [Planctomycetia bacterium]|nr:PDZ domain-containing protein [Planctomycetia bacterium]
MRAVKMEGVDLSQFQFDYDQTWCVFFLNADGTVYGRYGTRAGRAAESTSHISIDSFKKALERALKAHRGYPRNKSELAAKRGEKPEHLLAEKIPGMQRHDCIHCHQVRETILRTKWQEKKLAADDLWCYPLPENIGLSIDVDDGLRVESVEKGSPAAAAGVEAGDVLATLNGQRLLSQADIQWVLHNAPTETKLTATLTRGGKTMTKTISLAGDWKKTDLMWRASSGPGLRYGLWTEPLAASEKKQRGLAEDEMAISVKNLFLPRAEPLAKAGLKVGDVIVAVDGKAAFNGETDFFTFVRLDHPPGDKVRLTILRGKERRELEVSMW